MLNPNESECVKAHAAEGYKLSLPLKKNLGEAMRIIRRHHEKLDGSGYQDGLNDDEISMPVRILTVVDIYDILVTDPPYRKWGWINNVCTFSEYNKAQSRNFNFVGQTTKV